MKFYLTFAFLLLTFGVVFGTSSEYDSDADTVVIEASETESPPAFSRVPSSACSLGPIEKGFTNLCYADLLRYTFNSETRKCEEFSYGGCFGTLNLFNTKDACEINCGENARK